MEGGKRASRADGKPSWFKLGKIKYETIKYLIPFVLIYK